MIVNVHIERLVLDGVADGPGHAARVESAVREELARLWSQTGASSLPQVSAAVPLLRGRSPGDLGRSTPSLLGSAVARSLHGAIVK
jgi:hypothetical protein